MEVRELITGEIGEKKSLGIGKQIEGLKTEHQLPKMLLSIEDCCDVCTSTCKCNWIFPPDPGAVGYSAAFYAGLAMSQLNHGGYPPLFKGQRQWEPLLK